MNIPLVDLKSQYLSIKLDIDRAIGRVLDSGSYVMGTEVKLFEEEWAEFCGTRYCIGVSSCTDALYLAIRALCGNGGLKVVTTPATFFATTQAIIQAGNFPSFIDIDETGNLPPLDFGDQVAVPVNLYGRPGDWSGSSIIEDAAQSHGILLRGKIACHSFYPTKNLGAFGMAGAVVTNDLGLDFLIREMRTYGERERFVHYYTTGNFRIDEIQAAILRAKLPYLRGWNESRRQIALMYNEHLSELSDVIHLPKDHPLHVYHAYVIRCEGRDDLAKYLGEHGIQTAIRYPVPMHLQPSLRHLNYHEGDFPQAEAWAKENLNLPIYPEMTSEQVEYIASRIREWTMNYGKNQ